MKPISHSQFYEGIAPTKHSTKGFDNIVNGDVHSDIGSITGNGVAYSDTTANTPNETCLQCTTPTGTTYFFSTTSGKIWKRTEAGVYSTITANTHTSGHRGCIHYNGFVRFWTKDYLGKFISDTEASRNNTHGTFANGIAWGCCEENLSLYITDGKYIASVNSSESFNPNALDIPPQYIGICLIPDGFTNILLGTTIWSNIQRCRTFLWDTYSDSFTLSDEIPEPSVNCFINCDDIILAQCGDTGNLYQWNGQTLSLWENKLKDVTTGIGSFMSTIVNSIPYIAANNKIFSIFRKNATMPRVIVQDYTATANIYSLGTSNGNLFASVTGGVNLISTNKAVVTIDTLESYGQFNDVVVDYQSYPEGIGIQTKVDGGSWVTQTPIIDTINKKVYFDGGLSDCNYIQGRVTLSPNPSDLTVSPVITNISFL